MAHALYQALVQVSDDPAAAYLNLGICNDAMGDEEGTRAAFERFLELVPEDNPDASMVRERLAALP
jgi:Tfp pilus assembly protein PilF